MKNTALIIVDLQNDYYEGGKFPLHKIAAATTNAAALIAGFRAARLPVIHVRHEVLRKPAPFFEPGSPGAEIHDDVAPKDGETVFTKNFPNSFRETGLLEHLRANDITEVTIAGAMSHFCIDATSRAACDFGFDVSVAHDACATRDLEFDGVASTAGQVHAAFMAALAMGYAAVLPSDKILADMAS